MLFNSFQFLIFLPLVAWLHGRLPERCKNLLLLVASLYFYACWSIYHLPLLLGAVLSAYLGGVLVMGASSASAKKIWVTLVVVLNIGLLAVFKYYHFIAENVAHAGALIGFPVHLPEATILLPMGISFFTFQAVGYVVDAYRGQIAPGAGLRQVGLFISFFPQLVAGPIERANALMPQLNGRRTVNPELVQRGLQRMVWGFFKKVVIADNLSPFVDQVFRAPESSFGLITLVAILAFAIQIYCDFSGYCDIALGAANLFGVSLMENFRRPYFACNLVEFWRRWHVSLSSWFRDYVYIPLGGSRMNPSRALLNLLITFVVSGLWHGASWTFVAWGLLHGLFVVYEKIARGAMFRFFQQGLPGWILTMGVVLVSWILFRAESMADVRLMLSHARYLDWGEQAPALLTMLGGTGSAAFLLAACFLLFGVEWYEERSGRPLHDCLVAARSWVRFAYGYGMLMAIFLGGKLSSESFIYFQF